MFPQRTEVWNNFTFRTGVSPIANCAADLPPVLLGVSRGGTGWRIEAMGRLRLVALETPLSRCQSNGGPSGLTVKFQRLSYSNQVREWSAWMPRKRMATLVAAMTSALKISAND